MRPETVETLLELNRKFYADFGEAFAATRRRVQPGVRRVLNEYLPGTGLSEDCSLRRVEPDCRILDLGCGNGELAAAWARRGGTGVYLGLDFSPQLLAEARRTVEDLQTDSLRFIFRQADLGDADWAAEVVPDDVQSQSNGEHQAAGAFGIVLAFAVMHHLPGADLRRRLLGQVRHLLSPGGLFIHSEWQFHHSPRLLKRIQPWEKSGLDAADLEEGDTLLDWRYALPGQAEQVGLRYVHLFSRREWAAAADASGFEIVDEFESDGQGGRLGLYQVWRAGQA